jgi:hypothetical protein
MFESKIKLDKELLEKCRLQAEQEGYSSVEEFITHVLEKELRGGAQESRKEHDDIAKKLKGLGYIE